MHQIMDKLSCYVVQLLSCVQLTVTPWTVACQAPLSMGFTKQEYWNGLLFPPPRDLPIPGIEPASPAMAALAGGFFTIEPLGKPGQTVTIPYSGISKLRLRYIFEKFVFLILGAIEENLSKEPLDKYSLFCLEERVTFSCKSFTQFCNS